MSSPRFLLPVAFVLTLPSLRAQCALQWAPAAADGPVLTTHTSPGGELLVGGAFTVLDGVAAAGIARRSGGSWQPLGAGIQGTVRAIVSLPNGDLVAAGEFTAAGGVAADRIARWDGAQWTQLGSGFQATTGLPFLSPPGVHALLLLAGGDLVAGGNFTLAGATTVDHLARWDGSAWVGIGGGVSSSHLNPPPLIEALAELPNGDLVIGGNFNFAGGVFGNGNCARWDGANWSAMNAGWPGIVAPVQTLRVLANGELIGCGTTGSTINGTQPFVGRWTGTVWSPLAAGLSAQPFPASGVVRAMTVLPDGDLLVGGSQLAVAGSSDVNPLARFDGSAWTPVAGALDAEVQCLAMRADGAILVGGTLTTVAGQSTQNQAQLASSCPAAVAVAGAGCVGSAGPVTLTANLPWLGSTLHSAATGLPGSSIAVAVTSTAPATVPLSLLLPIAGPGCHGLVQADLAVLVVPFGGAAACDLVLPDAAALIGVGLWQYFAVLGFDAQGVADELLASDRLALTLGSY